MSGAPWSSQGPLLTTYIFFHTLMSLVVPLTPMKTPETLRRLCDSGLWRSFCAVGVSGTNFLLFREWPALFLLLEAAEQGGWGDCQDAEAMGTRMPEHMPPGGHRLPTG